MSKPYGSVWRDAEDNEIVMALGVDAAEDDDGPLGYEMVVLLSGPYTKREAHVTDRQISASNWEEIG